MLNPLALHPRPSLRPRYLYLAVSLLGLAGIPAAAQQSLVMDPLLGMPAEQMTCQPGWRCDARLIRNPASLDPQVITSKIRNDGQAGFILPIRTQTVWPASAQVRGDVATLSPPMPAVEMMQKLIIPKRVLEVFPGAKLVRVEHENTCPPIQNDRVDCAIALLTFTSRENHPMEATAEIDVRYILPGAGVQGTDATIIILFAPQGQLRSLPLTGPQMQVNPQWHQREQARAQQFALDYQRRQRDANTRIVENGQEQVAAIQHWGDVVRSEDRHAQNGIDESSAKFAGYVGDHGVSWRWRNTKTGEILSTDHNEPPGPDWVSY